jgi:hypothetical protein
MTSNIVLVKDIKLYSDVREITNELIIVQIVVTHSVLSSLSYQRNSDIIIRLAYSMGQAQYKKEVCYAGCGCIPC